MLSVLRADLSAFALAFLALAVPIKIYSLCEWSYNPPAYLRCGELCEGFLDNLAFRSDFLWWRACGEGVALGDMEGVRFHTRAPSRMLVEKHSRTKESHFHYEPGFRLGVSHVCPPFCWDITLNWTHFRSKARARGESKERTETIHTILIPFWERRVGLIPDHAKSVWTLTINLVDLVFERKYYVSPCFMLKPHIGLRGAGITQSYRVESQANRTGESIGQSNSYKSHASAKNYLLAVGPNIGCEAELSLGCGFSLFGEAAGAIVFGRFDRHSKEKSTQFSSINNGRIEFFYRTPRKFDSCSSTMTDLLLGIKWNRCFEWCNRCHPVTIAVAWESHAFYDLNRFNFEPDSTDIGIDGNNRTPFFPRKKKRGDLYTQGLAVSSTIAF